jgi:hypothetical protein
MVTKVRPDYLECKEKKEFKAVMAQSVTKALSV